MADSRIVHNHTPKSETEKQGLFDLFRKKDEDNEEDKSDSLLAKLHITDSSSGLSDEEEKKKDKTMKEKAEEKFEEDKVKMNVRIIQAEETALNLKQKIGEKVGGYDETKQGKENDEQKAKYEEVIMQPPESSCEPAANAETEHKEQKGIFEKIKEMLPGYQSKSQEEIKKEKEFDK